MNEELKITYNINSLIGYYLNNRDRNSKVQC